MNHVPLVINGSRLTNVNHRLCLIVNGAIGTNTNVTSKHVTIWLEINSIFGGKIME